MSAPAAGSTATGEARSIPPGLRQAEWLPRFAERFETVEVNNSFYRLPELATFERWRHQTPAGFVMAVKASRYVTHIRRLRDADDAVARLWERALGLGPRLGPVLFQLPPRFPVEAGRLADLIDVLPPGMRAAFEFRDGSWHTDEVHTMLDRAGCALVWPDRRARRHRAVPLLQQRHGRRGDPHADALRELLDERQIPVARVGQRARASA